MITLPNGKICMNEQEAIQWLLDNCPMPFQCSANYAAGTEIGLGTIVNPSPAKVKVGSIIFFADSKVSTVVSVNSNSFICSDQYNDLVDDVVYVSNVQLNQYGQLIVTLSNGTEINAGLIKQVLEFVITPDQHLRAVFNDGVIQDLGAIFSGNISISGDLAVSGNITGNSIIENMTGYSFLLSADMPNNEAIYAGVCKNGNKITFVLFGKFTKTSETESSEYVGSFIVPLEVANKLVPYSTGPSNSVLAQGATRAFHGLSFYDSDELIYAILKSNNVINFTIRGANNLTNDVEYFYRIEQTFLLSNNLAA